jgi:toxin ParE1/3/4
VKLRYTPAAFDELSGILDYIAERSPSGARNVKARVQAITALLEQFPECGQVTSERGLRRIQTAPYPFVVFYELTPAEIVVVGVRHAARDPDSNPR